MLANRFGKPYGARMSRTYPLVDRILDGQLDEYLAQKRAEGMSFRAISLDLRDRYGVNVSDETVRCWVGSGGEAA